MFTLNPTSKINHPVIVVPMLAPIITPADCLNDRSPAFTKLTVITVVTEEDWTIDVIPKPLATPLQLLEVMALSICLSLDPADLCRPSLMSFMP